MFPFDKCPFDDPVEEDYFKKKKKNGFGNYLGKLRDCSD